MNYRDLVEKLSAIELGEEGEAVAPATNSYVKPKPGQTMPSDDNTTAVDPATAKTSIIPGQQPDIGHGSTTPPGAPITPQGATPAAPVNPNNSQANDIKNQISAMQNALMALRNPTATAPTPTMQPTTNASVGQQAAIAAQKAATSNTQAKPGEPTRPILEAKKVKIDGKIYDANSDEAKAAIAKIEAAAKVRTEKLVKVANMNPQELFKGEMWYSLTPKEQLAVLQNSELNQDALKYHAAERKLETLPKDSPEREQYKKQADAAYGAWSAWRAEQLKKEGKPAATDQPANSAEAKAKAEAEAKATEAKAKAEAEAKATEAKAKAEAEEKARKDAEAAKNNPTKTEVKPEDKKKDNGVTSAVGMGSKDKPNDAVKKMQQQLLDAGYKLDKFGADGIFRAETQKALAQFQADNKLKDQKGRAAGNETNPILAKAAAEKNPDVVRGSGNVDSVNRSLNPKKNSSSSNSAEAELDKDLIPGFKVNGYQGNLIGTVIVGSDGKKYEIRGFNGTGSKVYGVPETDPTYGKLSSSRREGPSTFRLDPNDVQASSAPKVPEYKEDDVVTIPGLQIKGDPAKRYGEIVKDPKTNIEYFVTGGVVDGSAVHGVPFDRAKNAVIRAGADNGQSKSSSSDSPIPGGMDDVAQKMGLKGSYDGSGNWKDASGKTTHKWSDGTWKPVEASAPADASAASGGQSKADNRSAAQIQMDNAAKVESDRVQAFLTAHPGVTYDKNTSQFKDEKGQHLGSWNPNINPKTNQMYGIDISSRKDFKTTVPGVHTGVEPAVAPTVDAGSASTSKSRSISGTLLKGKADGILVYNGEFVKPGDPLYAEAEQALIDTKKTQDAARAASELKAAQDSTAAFNNSGNNTFKASHRVPNRFTVGDTQLMQRDGKFYTQDGKEWTAPLLSKEPSLIAPPSGSSPVIQKALPPGKASDKVSANELDPETADAMVRQSTLAERRVSLASVVDEIMNEDWKDDVKKFAGSAADTTSDWMRGTNNTITGGQWPKVTAAVKSALPGSGTYQQELEREREIDSAAEKRSPRAFNAVKNTLKDPGGTANDAVRVAANTLTFGLPDRLEAGTNALINKAKGSKETLGNEFDDELVKSWKLSQDAERRSPAASEIGSMAGNVVGLTTGVGAAKATGALLRNAPKVVKYGVGVPATIGSAVAADIYAGKSAHDITGDDYWTNKYTDPEPVNNNAGMQKINEDLSRITKLAGLRK
jgi:hypothetical protein